MRRYTSAALPDLISAAPNRSLIRRKIQFRALTTHGGEYRGLDYGDHCDDLIGRHGVGFPTTQCGGYRDIELPLIATQRGDAPLVVGSVEQQQIIGIGTPIRIGRHHAGQELRFLLVGAVFDQTALVP